MGIQPVNILSAWHVDGSDMTGALNEFRLSSLQQNPGWFDSVIPVYPCCPGNWR